MFSKNINVLLITFCFEDYEREPCPVSSLLQFHDRYLEYLRVAKDQSDPSYDPGFWDISRLTYEERKDIIEVNQFRQQLNIASR